MSEASQEPGAGSPRAPRGVGGARVLAPRPLALALAVVIGLAYMLHLREWLFLCDDAFISFRYARNLGEHGALVYNLDPLEFVEGYTNFLWVLVLAGGVALGLPPEQLAPALTGLAGLVALTLTARISAQLRARVSHASHRVAGPERAFELVDLGGPALLVTLPEFVVWGSSGLETGVAAALGLTAIWAWLDGRILGAAVAAALAGLTRPDALGWIACFGLAWLVVEGVGLALRVRGKSGMGEVGQMGGQGQMSQVGQALRGLPWRRVAVAAAVFVALLGAQLLWRRSYYGEWLPNTWAVKQSGALLREDWGLPYLKFWVARAGVVALAPLVLGLRARTLGTTLLLGTPSAGVLIYAWSVGGDFMAYGRFVLPATILLALWAGAILADVHGRLLERAGERPRLRVLAWVAWAALVLGLVGASASRIPQRIAEDRGHAHLHIAYDEHDRPVADTRGFEGVQAMDRFAAVRLAAGAELARRVPADTWISVGAAGALPYASRLPAFDAYALVDPGVLEVAEPITGARARPGHQLYAPMSYILEREPDLICHIGWEAPRPPSLRDARRRARGDFAWACVETGPIEDRRAEGGTLESRFYCCLRPGDSLEALDPRHRSRR